MAVSKLIEELSILTPDTEVRVWAKGDTTTVVDMTDTQAVLGIGWNPPLDRCNPEGTTQVVLIA